MQVQVDIGFDQLVKIAKKLPENQWKKLKNEVEQEKPAEKKNFDMEAFLLAGPTLNEEQIDVIKNNRKAINKWRTI